MSYSQKKFLVYKSSAGSGKTHSLVKEYLKLVIANKENFRQILAITFTNMAADEMKNRVLKNLEQIANYKKNNNSESIIIDIISELSEELKLPEDEICKRAHILITSILHNYSDFSICTIDSFIHRILKTFAHDLYLPSGFEVELDSDQLLDEAVDILISKAGTDEKLTKLLVEFTESKADSEKNWHIENDIKLFAEALLKEEGQLYLEKIKDISTDDLLGFIEKTYAFTGSFENKIGIIAKDAFRLIEVNNINIDSFYYGKKGIGKYFSDLSKGVFSKILPNSYVSKTVEDDKWHGPKAESSQISSIEKIKTKLKVLYSDIEEIINKDFKTYVLLQIIQSNIYPLALLNEIKHIIDEIKAENSIIHISEFNKIISGIVLQEPVPFIYERFGEKYKHFLIDEFQDTSKLQWENFIPLIDNSLSENHFNMLVGDEKQAIYRWRNGDAEIMRNLPNIHYVENSIDGNPEMHLIRKEREQNLTTNYYKTELNTNFRSRKLIVEFNNGLFGFISNNLDNAYKSVYSNVSQLSKDESNEGYIHIEFIDPEDEIENDREYNSTLSTYERHNVKRTHEIINDLLKDGFEPRDIAILCRSNRNASQIAQFLISNNIPVVSSESLLLKNSPIVNFMISSMKYISANDNIIAEYEIINYLKTYHNNGINDILSQIKRLEGKTLYQLCEDLLLLINNQNSSTATLNSNPFIIFFLDTIFQYSSKKNDDLDEFLDWWEENKEKKSLIISEEMNSVRVMTIHKSKGLQFPAVIFPFAKEESGRTKDWLWVDTSIKELPGIKAALLKNKEELKNTVYSELYESEKAKSYLDMINLLYVTLTRAEERIYVLSKSAGSKSDATKSLSGIFTDYLKHINKYEEHKRVFTLGQKHKYQSKRKNIDTEKVILKDIIKKNSKIEIQIKRESISASEAGINYNKETKKTTGIILHKILSEIKYIDSIDGILNNIMLIGNIDEEEKQKMKSILENLFMNEEIRKYFSRANAGVVKNEIELISGEGKVYRADRIIIKNNQVTILEFKSGKEQEAHKEQINTYARLLEESGYMIKEKVLVYTEEARIIKL